MVRRIFCGIIALIIATCISLLCVFSNANGIENNDEVRIDISFYGDSNFENKLDFLPQNKRIYFEIKAYNLTSDSKRLRQFVIKNVKKRLKNVEDINVSIPKLNLSKNYDILNCTATNSNDFSFGIDIDSFNILSGEYAVLRFSAITDSVNSFPFCANIQLDDKIYTNQTTAQIEGNTTTQGYTTTLESTTNLQSTDTTSAVQISSTSMTTTSKITTTETSTTSEISKTDYIIYTSIKETFTSSTAFYEFITTSKKPRTRRTTSTTKSSEKNLLFGDADKSGKINAKDATLILVDYARRISGGESNLHLETSDVNCDGSIDAKDATAILVFYANKIYNPDLTDGDLREFVKLI